jgi:adenylate cyclase
MSLFIELKRRKVVRVAVVYAATAFMVLQAADIMLPRLAVPEWTMTLVVVFAVLGFPIALVLGWALELTPEGIKRTESAAAGGGEAATAPALLGKRTVLAAAALVILGIGLGAGWFLKPSDSGPVPETGPAGLAAVTGEEQPSAPVAVQQSIAVLPFVNMSADPEQEYFADGLSEELLNVLAQVPAFRVVGRSSSFAFKGQNIDLREIGERLGVEHLLEGSVRRSGERVRVTAQLIRASDGTHLWSESYERTLADVFAIQDDIAGNVLRALQVVLDEREQQRMRNAGVRDVEAFIAYQKGLELYEQAHGSLPLLPTLLRANEYFDQAIARVPEFGAAYYLKADYYSHILFSSHPSGNERAAALQAVRAALDVAYASAHQPAQRAAIDVDRTLFSDNWTNLPDRIERVLAHPGCTQLLWMEAAMTLGYASEMVPFYDRLASCDPLGVFPRVNGPSALAIAGDVPAALVALSEVERALGEHSMILGTMQWLLLALGSHEEARALGERISPDDDFFGLPARVAPLAAAGRIDDALAAMSSWLELHGQPEYVVMLGMLAATGQRDRANALAAELDAMPAGPMVLLASVNICGCGLPFDMGATPNFARRIAETSRPWPPPAIIRYPAKDW